MAKTLTTLEDIENIPVESRKLYSQIDTTEPYRLALKPGMFDGFSNVERVVTESLLTGSLEGLFDKMPKLKTVILIDQMFDKLPQNLFQHNLELREVIISGWELKKIPQKLFVKNSKLELVDFSHNELCDIPKDLLKHNKQLKSVRFCYNPLTVTSPLKLNEETWILASHNNFLLTVLGDTVRAGCRMFDTPWEALQHWHKRSKTAEDYMVRTRASEFIAALIAHYKDIPQT